MNIGDRVRITQDHVWRNAFGVIVEADNDTGDALVKLVQPTRRPSYVDWGLKPAKITHPIIVAEEHLEVVS